jgi:1,2-diacylglycerol 3-alpha-glucosyltransferase
MNIALFTETYYPEINGVAASVYLLKQELEKRGHEVYVITTTTPGAPDHEHNVYRVPSLPCLLITERRVGLFYHPKLAHIIRHMHLDVIHTQTEFSLGIFGRIMAKELHLPLVHTYHTIYEDYTHYFMKFKSLDERAKSFVRSFTKVCCNTVEQVIVPTEKVRELLLSYHVRQKIAVIPTGIDLRKFEAEKYDPKEILAIRESFGILPEEKVILYLGRISQEKNLEEILVNLPPFLKRHPDAKFLMIGGGPDRERLEQLVGSMTELSEDARRRIIFGGEQPWDVIGKFYRLGDVFVSASNSETQGLTYIEAMASGLPVVAREDPCLEDILEQGYNGYTFTDEDGFLDGLEKVLYEGDGKVYGEHSLAKVKKYSAQEFAKSIEKLYMGLIAEADREEDRKIPLRL